MAWAVVYLLHIYCFPLGIKTNSVLLCCSISFPDCISLFIERTAWLYLHTICFFPYSSLYMCNYFYIAFPEVSGSLQIPEMLFCLQQMLWEVYGTSKESVSLVTFSKFACQHCAIHPQRHCSLVHGERASEVNNVCSLGFCFEYTGEGKIVVDVCIAGDKHA